MTCDHVGPEAIRAHANALADHGSPLERERYASMVRSWLEETRAVAYVAHVDVSKRSSGVVRTRAVERSGGSVVFVDKSFLFSALCGVLFCSCSASAPEVQKAREPSEQVRTDASIVRYTELAEGVWMHTSVKEIDPWGEVPSNGLVLVLPGEEGALLIDTAWDDAQTIAILDWSQQNLGVPITRAVLTHAHEDKMGGVNALRDRGVETFASTLSNTLAPERGLSPAANEIAFVQGISQHFAPVVVMDPGGGHTHDNIVVAWPERSLLFGGCLIRPGDSSSLGNTADADMAHWDEAVKAVASQFEQASIVVPSHGPPGGRELLSHTVELVETSRQEP